MGASSLALALGQIDQIVAAVDADHHVGLRRIVAEDRACAARMLAGLVVDRVRFQERLVHGQPQRFGQIDRQEPGRQLSLRDAFVLELRGRARLALLRDRAEAVVRGDEDVGVAVEAELLQRRHDGFKVLVRDLDGGERRRPVDAGRQLIDAVALRMLRAVRVGRPVEQHERLALLLEVREQHLGDDVAIVFLLDDVGGLAGRLAALRAAGCLQRQSGLLELLDHVRPQLDAVLLAGVVVEEDRGLAVELRQVVDADRPDLAEARR